MVVVLVYLPGTAAGVQDTERCLNHVRFEKRDDFFFFAAFFYQIIVLL